MPSLEIPSELEDSSSNSSSLSADISPSLNVTNGFEQISRAPPLYALAALPAFGSSNASASASSSLQPMLPQPRRFSFDRELAASEEEADNHWPGQTYLLPVLLPQVAEPTLDELLRRVTGRSDLQNVECVKLRVISYVVSLSRLSVYLPRLVQLDLSGSVLHSLRDLGCDLLHLTRLNVANCGLSSFDGTSGLPGLRELIADANMVQLVGPLADLSLLTHLSARHNRIGDLATLTFLGMCPHLMELELQGNPVTHLRLYRETLQRSVPTLELLDGEPFGMVRAERGEVLKTLHATTTTTEEGHSNVSDTTSISSLSSSDACSLTSATNSEALPHSLDLLSLNESDSTSMSPSDAPERPATSCGVEKALNSIKAQQQQQHKAASASTLYTSKRCHNSSSSSLLGAQPLTGSVLAVARRRRKRSLAGNTSTDSGSICLASAASSSSSSSACSSSSLSSSAMPWLRSGTNNLDTQTMERRVLPSLPTPPQLPSPSSLDEHKDQMNLENL